MQGTGETFQAILADPLEQGKDVSGRLRASTEQCLFDIWFNECDCLHSVIVSLSSVLQVESVGIEYIFHFIHFPTSFSLFHFVLLSYSICITLTLQSRGGGMHYLKHIYFFTLFKMKKIKHVRTQISELYFTCSHKLICVSLLSWYQENNQNSSKLSKMRHPIKAAII